MFLVSVVKDHYAYELKNSDKSIIFKGVPMKGCHNKGKMSQYCRTKKGLYDPKKSRTSKAVRKLYHVEYGIGDTVGFIYEDSFAVGFLVHFFGCNFDWPFYYDFLNRRKNK